MNKQVQHPGFFDPYSNQPLLARHHDVVVVLSHVMMSWP